MLDIYNVSFMNFLFLSSYMFSLGMLMAYTSLTNLWVWLELNMIVFMCSIYYFGGFKGMSMGFGMEYFIIQSLGSFLFLYSCLDNFSDLSFQFFLFFYLAILLKGGLFPFHYWVFQVSPHLFWLFFCALLSLQKLFFFLMAAELWNAILSFLVIFSSAAGAIFIFFSSEMRMMLISSSIYGSIWGVLFFSDSLIGGLLYLFSLFLFLLMLSSWDSYYSLSVLNLSFLLMFLVGLPPFNSFFLKFSVICDMLMSFSYWMFILVWLISFISIVGYFFFFTNYMFFKQHRVFIKGNNDIIGFIGLSFFLGFLMYLL